MGLGQPLWLTAWPRGYAPNLPSPLGMVVQNLARIQQQEFHTLLLNCGAVAADLGVDPTFLSLRLFPSMFWAQLADSCEGGHLQMPSLVSRQHM